MSISKKLQSFCKNSSHRNLTESEIFFLKKSGNFCSEWNRFLIEKNCTLNNIKNCTFSGDIVINSNSSSKLVSSSFENVIIGENTTVRNTRLIQNYILESDIVIEDCGQIISNEGFTSFMLEICNENGRRAVNVSPEMNGTSIWLTSRKILNSSLSEQSVNSGYMGNKVKITNLSFGNNLHLDHFTVIKNSSCLENVLTESAQSDPVEINNVISLKNCIFKKSCRISNGVIADSVFLDENSTLKNGSRVFHVFLGANSTIACCEVLHSFLASFHEQHHNNSFLIASSVLGQSNIAAGATIGSNHNSRSADGEIIAGRGFWPGLNVSLKHNSYFASFTLIAKASYPSEIYNPFPFSLIYRDKENLIIRPAFLFKYNIFALKRNTWKFERRDKREISKIKPFYSFMEPDTVCEILYAIQLLEKGTIMEDNTGFFEKSKSSVRIQGAEESLNIYKNKLTYYLSIKVLAEIQLKNNTGAVRKVSSSTKWILAGDSIIRKETINTIKTFKSISDKELNKLLNEVIFQEQKYYYPYYISVLTRILNLNNSNELLISRKWILSVIELHKKEKEEILSTLKKDKTEKFRQITFLYDENPDDIYGTLEENPFIQDYLENYEIILNMLNNYLSRIS